MKFTTLEPEDKRSRIPDPLAFIIYRLLPILCLSAFVYFVRQRYSPFLNDDHFCWLCFWNISLISFSASLRRSPRGLGYNDYIISRDFSPFEKLSRVRVLLESFDETRSAKFPFAFRRKSWTPEQAKKEIQLQKERLAIYLSGSRQGIPPCLSHRENFYLLTIWLITKTCILRIFAPEFKSWHDFLEYFTYQNVHHLASFACLITLLDLLNFQFGLWSDWNMRLSWTAEFIRYSCGRIGQNKVTENKRAELEWWIEGILREDSDSFDLAEERKRVIIAPIQKMICETTFWEKWGIYSTTDGRRKLLEKEETEKFCDDCNSAHYCLSKSVKLQ
ncbi:hypothetical protein OCU04_009285 [Sclerotinia nivalis]|uniref:Uncharacterized protein n=1 Tax=Sclerotinia nivalis TaxID=352851 RepID=A0A9X0AEQ4_9HELO|nr:hypothetical protein OCU04_009285 [Sclerotinia nivalis]